MVNGRCGGHGTGSIYLSPTVVHLSAEVVSGLDTSTVVDSGPLVTSAHEWRQGDVLMWDNRAMLHRGRPWDYNKERSMVRTTISATASDGLNEVKPPVLH